MCSLYSKLTTKIFKVLWAYFHLGLLDRIKRTFLVEKERIPVKGKILFAAIISFFHLKQHSWRCWRLSFRDTSLFYIPRQDMDQLVEEPTKKVGMDSFTLVGGR